MEYRNRIAAGLRPAMSQRVQARTAGTSAVRASASKAATGACSVGTALPGRVARALAALAIGWAIAFACAAAPASFAAPAYAEEPAAASDAVLAAAPAGLVPQDADLAAALRSGESAVALSSTGTSEFTQGSDGAGAYLAGREGAELTATVNGPGWLIFKWKFTSTGEYTNKVHLTVDGVLDPNEQPNRSYDWFTASSAWELSASASSSVDWTTCCVQLDGAGQHTVAWTRAGTTAIDSCLADIHFATAKNTQISLVADSGIESSSIVVLDEDHKTESTATAYSATDGVRPYGVVSFSAKAKQGKVFAGWKTSPDADGFVYTASPYRVRVFSEPLKLYAVTKSPFSGTGTQADPFLLSNRADLEALGKYVNGGETFAGCYFKIAQNIDCGIAPFETIGASGYKSFSGQVDGNGKTITFSGVGALFNAISGGSVKDLALNATVVNEKACRSGVLADSTTEGTTIENIELKGSFSTPKAGGPNNFGIGGLVGSATSTTITNCTVTADISTGIKGNTEPCLGGVVGTTSMNTVVSRCVVTGKVDGGTVGSAIGGIVGKSNSPYSTVQDCYSSSAVSGNMRVGGIVGYLSSGTVKNCEHAGTVAGNDRVGGIAGSMGVSAVATACLATGSVSAAEADGVAGGIVGYAEGDASLSDCLSLVQSVGASASANAARVVAQLKGAFVGTEQKLPTLAGNAAWGGMTLAGAVVAQGDADAAADGRNGASVGTTALSGEAVVSPASSWGSGSWTVAAGKKPQLNATPAVSAASGQDLPAYVAAISDDKTVVVPPAFAVQSYTGSTLSVSAPAGAGYALSGTTSAVEVGVYTATATLLQGYVWTDGTLAAKQVTWQIVPASDPGGEASDPNSLKAALMKPGATDLAPVFEGAWSVATESGDAGARSFVRASKGAADAKVRVTVPGEGWLLWDWKLGDFDKQAWPKAKIDVSTTTDDNFYPFGSLESSTDASGVWSTAVVKVGKAGSVEWAWTPLGENAACIGNVRFVTAMTPVAAAGDANVAQTRVSVEDLQITAADPRQGSYYSNQNYVYYGAERADVSKKVTWSATPKAGYVVTGWRAGGPGGAQVTDQATYQAVPYDEPATYYATTAKAFDRGSGTQADPFVLSSQADLVALDAYVNRGSDFEGCFFKLAGDIKLAAGTGSTPAFSGIGSAVLYSSFPGVFRGTFDGDGHTISGLANNVGLFGRVGSTGVVKNLSVEGEVQVEMSSAYRGIVASICAGTLENVSSSGSITSDKAGSATSGTGGLVGLLDSGATMANCSSTARVAVTANGSTDPAAGGLVGRAGNNATIRDSSFTGTVTGGDQGSAIGGIVGVSYGGAVVERCYATGDFAGNMRVGGIVGSMSSGSTVRDCEFSGSVSAAGSYAGGIVGYASTTKTNPLAVERCLVVGSVAAAGDAAGAIVGFSEGEGSLTANVSLAESVDAASAAKRIAGDARVHDLNGAMKMTDNVSWADTAVNGAVVARADANGANAQGADVSGYDLLHGAGVSRACAGWGDAWTVVDNAKPQLKAHADLSGTALPDYLFVALEEDGIVLSDDVFYRGKGEVVPDATVEAHGAKLVEGSDYELCFTTSTGLAAEAPIQQAGNYLAVFTGKGAYGATVSKPFTVMPALSDCAVRAVADRAYTGKAIRPLVTVYYKNVDGLMAELEKNEDYTFAYENNVNVGAASIVITGSDDYPGTLRATFNIVKAAGVLRASAAKATQSVVYSAKAARRLTAAKAFSVSEALGKVTYAKKSGKAGISVSSAGVVTVRKGMPVGSYPVVVTAKAAGDATHGVASQDVKFTLKVAKAANTLALKAKTASASAAKLKKAAVVLSAAKLVKASGAQGKLTYAKAGGSAKLKVAKNGKVTVAKGTRAGTYTLKLKVKAAGTKNYKAAAKTVKVKVKVK